MDNLQKAVVFGTLAIAIAILFSGGIYKFDKVNAQMTHRYNKFTGSAYLCIDGRGCKSISSEEK